MSRRDQEDLMVLEYTLKLGQYGIEFVENAQKLHPWRQNRQITSQYTTIGFILLWPAHFWSSYYRIASPAASSPGRLCFHRIIQFAGLLAHNIRFRLRSPAVIAARNTASPINS